MDLVQNIPHPTGSVLVNTLLGRRYNVLVEVNVVCGDHCLRVGRIAVCSNNEHSANMTDIICYDSGSTGDPTPICAVTLWTCGDKHGQSLFRCIDFNVGNFTDGD